MYELCVCMLYMNSIYVYLLLKLMYELCVCMLLNAYYVFFQLNADYVLFQKLNADCVFDATVMCELTSDCLSLRDPW
jgi:hypothetical protein